jgi:rfaE bifunctional protein kinase chain/domain/rfaE bifunctional protein nucleotidyltransferase chain/domain
MNKTKLLNLDDLVAQVKKLQKARKKVVQSHGIFDLIHPGIIEHLKSSKEFGDILIVSVVKDKDVRRGPGRPIFPERMRAENVSALSMVDYVCIVDDEIPFECVKKIKPDVFAKGQAFKERDHIASAKIYQEEKEFFFDKTRIHETGGFSMSSTGLINQFMDLYPDETRVYLARVSRKYSFQRIRKEIDQLKDLKVLLVGDGIIDEYHYCQPLNKSLKAQLIVNQYLEHEVFAGGAFAIANHLAGLCKDVHVISLLGRNDAREDFIRANLFRNVMPTFFYREDSPTITKKRYINQHANQKLFEVNYLNDRDLPKTLESRLVKHLSVTAPKFDLVLVSDFGHGFITKRMIKALREHSKILAINTQTNGANAGYNLVTKYAEPDFVCLDEPEVRLATQDKYGDIEKIALGLLKSVKARRLVVTLGRKGSIAVDDKKRVVTAPIFSTKVVDTVGAGDAFFSFTAPCIAAGLPLDLVSFVGNAVGALAVQIVGNKKPVEKAEFLNFVYSILKQRRGMP